MEYEAISHVSEAGIRAFGKDINEAFTNTALGMFALLTDLSTVKPFKEIEIILSSDSLEELLVDFLNELLFYFDSAGFLFASFNVQIKNNRLKGKVLGEEYQAGKHPLKTQIKATTYYGLKVKQNEKVTIEVYFDV